MSLQRRLTLFSTLVVVIPLALAGFIVQRVMVEEVERRALLSLEPVLDIAETAVRGRVATLDQQVAAAAGSGRLERLVARGDEARVARDLRSRLRPRGVDVLVVVGAEGRAGARAANDAEFVEGVERPSAADVAASPRGIHAVYARSETAPIGDTGAHLVGALWLDDDVLVGDSDERLELAIAIDGAIVAATEPVEATARVDADLGGRFTVDFAGKGTAEARRLAPGVDLLAWVPSSPLRELLNGVAGSLIAVLALSVVGIALLAYLMSRFITRPLEEISAGAQAIAEGRYDHRIPGRSSGELGDLAGAFNEMSQRLGGTIRELQESRAQLERAVQRAGQTFRSTHNMEQILVSLLETAIDAVHASGGIVWRFSPTRQELNPAVVRGAVEEVSSVPVGAGMSGLAAEGGTPLLQGPDAQPRHPGEPRNTAALAVPFYSQHRIYGVIQLLRSADSRPFGREDLNTVTFLAQQGSVAIENVALHEEARRLSLTDGLTGVWNRRYLQMQSRQVLATAQRFGRPFSILMLDLDNFKRVNDDFGHQRGDATLIEFSRRVSGALREVDTFVRYGGEEFLCLLPETDYSGARTTAEKIADVIKAEAFGDPGEEQIDVTVSIGVAAYPRHGSSFTSLVEAADQALYRAKQEGRDRVIVAAERPPNLSIAR
jgi:two-component system cell cycle response regulator